MQQHVEQGSFSGAVYTHNANFVVSVYIKIGILVDDFCAEGEIYLCSFHSCISLLKFLYDRSGCVVGESVCFPSPYF